MNISYDTLKEIFAAGKSGKYTSLEDWTEAQLKGDKKPEATKTSDTITPADIIDNIARQADRFIRGMLVKDPYALAMSEDAFTIIKETQSEEPNWNYVVGIAYYNKKWYVLKAKRSKLRKYFSERKYMEVEIPSWAKEKAFTQDDLFGGLDMNEVFDRFFGSIPGIRTR